MSRRVRAWTSYKHRACRDNLSARRDPPLRCLVILKATLDPIICSHLFRLPGSTTQVPVHISVSFLSAHPCPPSPSPNSTKSFLLHTCCLHPTLPTPWFFCTHLDRKGLNRMAISSQSGWMTGTHRRETGGPMTQGSTGLRTR